MQATVKQQYGRETVPPPRHPFKSQQLRLIPRLQKFSIDKNTLFLSKHILENMALLQKIRSVVHYRVFQGSFQCQISNGVISVGR